MFRYKTSKDYARLRSLLDGGKTVVTMTPAGEMYDARCTFSSRINTGEAEYYHIMDEYNSTDISDEEFSEWMKEMKLEFIEPLTS